MLILKDLSEQIIKSAIEVHKHLGRGFLEKVYENALIIELKNRELRVESQKTIDVNYKGQIVGRYIADIIVEDKIILEVKAIEQINSANKSQLLNYLKATDLELGIIINFGSNKLEIKRVVNQYS